MLKRSVATTATLCAAANLVDCTSGHTTRRVGLRRRTEEGGRGPLVDFNFTAFRHVYRAGKATGISTVLRAESCNLATLLIQSQLKKNIA